MTVVRRSGPGRFFTWAYWRIQLTRLWNGQALLNVVETFEADLPVCSRCGGLDVEVHCNSRLSSHGLEGDETTHECHSCGLVETI